MPMFQQGEWVRVGVTPRFWGFQATSVQKTEPDFLNGLYDKFFAGRRAMENRLRDLDL